MKRLLTCLLCFALLSGLLVPSGTAASLLSETPPPYAVIDDVYEVDAVGFAAYDDVLVYEQPTRSSAPLAQLYVTCRVDASQRVQTRYEGTWFYVTVGGIAGYMPQDDLNFPTTGPTPRDPYQPVPLDPWTLTGQRREGDTDEYVLWVQMQLKTLGYYTGSMWDLTGYLGDTTAEEIARFRRDHGLSASGVIDIALIDALLDTQQAQRIAPATLYVEGYYDYLPALDGRIMEGTRSEAVLWVQNCLNILGFRSDSGQKLAVDGDCGPMTIEAFQNFIEAHNRTCTQEVYRFQTSSKSIRLGHLRAMLEMYIARGYDLSRLRSY